VNHERQIIFFDGVCNLCNAFVDFLVRWDSERIFYFAPLQGSNAKQLLPAKIPAELNSVVLWNQGELHEKSDAALMVLQQLGGLWWLTKIFWVLPKGVRDWFYDRVAKNRYALFGKRETCRLPTPAERARFLD
jgi:predicted DCC family thiol-disulfide oxidoreductase YuxK